MYAYACTLVCHLMPCCHARPCHVMPCHVIPYHIISCHVMSCHVMSCHDMHDHFMRCHDMAMSCHSHGLPVVTGFDVECTARPFDSEQDLRRALDLRIQIFGESRHQDGHHRISLSFSSSSSCEWSCKSKISWRRREYTSILCDTVGKGKLSWLICIFLLST